MNYGLPYKGSKNRIAQWIVDQLPPAENFYDLFGGGGAITHCAMQSGKWKNFYLNDIRPGLTECFAMALRGEYSKPEYRRWISRDEFNQLKNGTTHSDCYFAMVWSFGNNMEDYMFAREKEEKKKKLFEQKRQNHASFNIGCVQSMESMESMERIERIERIENFAEMNTESLTTFSASYDQIKIIDNSIVYCDIPYRNKRTFKHCKNFDFEKFYKWCTEMTRMWHGRNIMLYISEYEMPNGFAPIAQRIKYVGCANPDSRSHAVEKLFVPDLQSMPIKGQQDLFENLDVKND